MLCHDTIGNPSRNGRGSSTSFHSLHRLPPTGSNGKAVDTASAANIESNDNAENDDDTDKAVVDANAVNTVISPNQAVDDAVPTVDVVESEFHEAIFHLARLLKSCLSLTDLVEDELKPWVKLWFQKSRQRLPKKRLLDCWLEFCDVWPKVRSGVEGNVLTKTWRAIQSRELPRIAEGFDPLIGKIILLCCELQRVHEGHFFLSGHALGKLIEMAQPTAAKILKLLVKKGILEITDDGGHFRAGRRMARCYRIRCRSAFELESANDD